MLKKILLWLFYLFLPLIIGLISSRFISNSVFIYKLLEKPSLSPSPSVFPIVWTILYLLMGISYFLLKKKYKYYDISNASFWYYLQLIINFFWPIFFFKNQALVFSFIWLVFLIATVIITFIKFYKLNKISGYLLIPYIIWLFFAAYLNLSVALIN